MDIFEMVLSFISYYDYKTMDKYMRKQDFYDAYVLDEYLSNKLKYVTIHRKLDTNDEQRVDNYLDELSKLRNEFVRRMSVM